MSRAGAIPYFGDAYMADTRHLSLEEHGAYHLLLLIAWRSPNCALPDDDKRIAQMLGITGKKWASLRPSVMAFWTRTEHGWEQKRLTKERRWVEEKSRKNRDAAEARWNDNSLKSNEPNDAFEHANGQSNAHANGDAPLPRPRKSSVDKSTDDPDRIFWEAGKAFIAAEARGNPGALIGKWCRDYGKEATAKALTRAQLERPVERVPFIVGCLKASKQDEHSWDFMP